MGIRIQEETRSEASGMRWSTGSPTMERWLQRYRLTRRRQGHLVDGKRFLSTAFVNLPRCSVMFRGATSVEGP